MIPTYYERVALLDTSAVIALHDPAEQFHADVRAFYVKTQDLIWAALDLTSHECFTTVRYAKALQPALEHYQFLRSDSFRLIRFEPQDEDTALDLLRRYSMLCLSFHDAICAAVMKRIGIYKIVTLDTDFHAFGFEVLPSVVR